ncbi:adenylyltransferase/cytidyltransferase family protein [Streptomyces sp. ZG43]|uniref:adenylyltransferase/cytidyltransferase family protein n=1 Tax=Streptomyces TaxID=1883 RepID=UPI000ABBB90D|nr:MULTISPECIES: adenylyltransferase/cytidyltransferase family protein [Streptomyces]RPK65382.1 Bifunctional protein HldE [Streptomyces sp. ADI96-15]UYM23128.1 adenylyltransferase/cytidyltransferase family protein [Streptomyces albus]WSB19123.1 adenylyltransferase/cytidyltransferase family protein [Streptomyces albidoflavus]
MSRAASSPSSPSSAVPVGHGGGLTLSWPGGAVPEAAAGGAAVVTGVFDLLHVGHVRFLAEVRERGLPLLVGVEDDRRTRGWKGPARPFQPAEERAELLRALRPVDGTFLVHGDPSVTDWTAYTALLAPLAPGAMAWTAHDPYTEQKHRAAAGLGARAWEIAETPDRSTTRIVSGRMPG